MIIIDFKIDINKSELEINKEELTFKLIAKLTRFTPLDNILKTTWSQKEVFLPDLIFFHVLLLEKFLKIIFD